MTWIQQLTTNARSHQQQAKDQANDCLRMSIVYQIATGLIAR